MTVIAWDGKTLAADKRAVNAGMARTVTKIRRLPNALLAWSGDHDVGAQLRDWFIYGAIKDEFPEAALKGDATLMVVARGKVRFYVAGPSPMEVEDNHVAIGSGRDYAQAAMALGKGAREAVELACQFDIDCGNGVDTLELPPCN
jgi:ATP-dependent protease HslVU (ClpYQ) peptidase subunit